MTFLLDKEIFQGILKITATIFHRYFFYSEECLERFFQFFQETIEYEYIYFFENACEEFKFELSYNKDKRKHFTTYFVSYYLHDIMVNDLHFTENELNAFENILPKFTGVVDDTKQSHKRAYY